MNARHGKIARLPRHLRHELNERLERAEPGPQLLDWLNALPEVRQVVQSNFAGVPISKQNLSEWRQGGFEEWRARQELWDDVREVEDFGRDLNADNDDVLADNVVAVLTARYA